MTGVCHAADAMLEGYFVIQAVAADGNRLNFQRRLDECGSDEELAALFVGLAQAGARLRNELAAARKQSLASLDEALIGSLLVEGALS